MKRFTLILSLLVAMVTTAMAQKAHQRVSHDGWTVTALNEAVVYGNEGGVAFIADDNTATFYHSGWSSNYDDGNGVNKGKDGLQAFMVELPDVMDDLSLITYMGRSDGNSSGWARGVRVYVFETLPTDWPEKGLSSLGYKDKEALLASSNTNLGEAAFDNTASAWDNDRTQKVGVFTTPKTGKYVLFIMESGSDAWLTCSDFQIYQLKDYAAIKENNPYFLQVTNAAAAGNQFIDTKTAVADNQNLSTVAISSTSVETYFAWTGTAWNIKDADGKYVGVTKLCAPPLQDAATDWHLLVNEDNTLTFFQNTYYGDEKKERCFLGGDVISNESVVKLYTDNYIYKAINVKLIDASAVTVKYIFTWNGAEKGTQEVETLGGELYPDVNFEFPFGVAATKPDGEIDAKEAIDGVITKTIVLESTLPFVYADEYKNINNWYYLQFHANAKNYLYYGGTADVLDASKTAVDASQKDNYTWGFIGDPFTGFTVVNYGAGEGKALNAGASGAIIGEEAQVLTLTASSHGENGFFMQNLSGDYTQRFNKQNNQVVYWSGADAGSTFMVVERPMTPAAELEALVEEIEAMNIVAGTNIGDYTEASVNALNEAIATAKALETVTADDVAALQAALEGLRVVLPDPAKFYYFDCTYKGDTEEISRKLHINNNNQLNWVATQAAFDAAGSRAIFQFEAGEAPNTVKIKSVHTQSYMGAISGNITFGETGADITIARSNSNEVANDLKPYAVMFTTDGTSGIHANTAPVSAWTNGAGSNHYVLREVEEFKHTLTVGNAGWATLMLGFNATIPADVTVYTIASQEDGYVTLAEATGVLQANVPVLVEAAAGNYVFAYTAEAATVKESGLEGTLYNKDITANAYVLGIPEGETEVCFAKGTTEGKAEGTFTNNANKAYFVPTNAQANIASYSFRFGEGTTGIEEITDNREQSTVIYDLTGRRVEAITAPGIYVVNGKKVLVK